MHTLTQANTFGVNSNSIASHTSVGGLFEQTHSSQGFGSTFLSSQGGGIRQSQAAAHQQHPGRQHHTTQMKFGTVGQEMLGGGGAHQV